MKYLLGSRADRRFPTVIVTVTYLQGSKGIGDLLTRHPRNFSDSRSFYFLLVRCGKFVHARR